jgi:hypothetical protein
MLAIRPRPFPPLPNSFRAVLVAGCVVLGTAPAGARGILAMRPGLPDRSGAIAAGDFNADGKPDILIANFEAGDISFFQEAAGGTYVERTPSPFVALEGPVFLATRDLNNDGRLDFVVVNRLGRGISVRLSDAQATFRATANLLLGRSPQSVAIADFNSDTRLDLVVTSQQEDRVYYFPGRGDGNFNFARTVDVRTPAQVTASTPAGAYGIAAADFDRDGRMDLAVTQRETDQVAILLGTGSGTFRTPVLVPTGRHPTHLTVVRLNDDGAPGPADDFVDLAVLLEGGRVNPLDTGEMPLPGGVGVLLGNGDGTFTPGTGPGIPFAEGPTRFAAGAIVGIGADGFDDLAVVNAAAQTLHLYGADGTGGYPAPVVLGGSGSTLRTPVAVALLDRDSDGSADRVAVSNFGGYSFTLFDGSLLTPFSENPLSPITATPQPIGIAAAGLDLGIGEDVTVLAGGSPAVNAFSAINNGFFLKLRSTPLPAGSGPTSLVLADFTQDGLLDAAVALTDADGSSGGGTASAVAILLGNGNATFGTGQGLCAGGTADGASCASDATCGGGTCTFSPSLGRCTGGTALGQACLDDTDCPSSTCSLPPATVPLAAPARMLLGVDLNPLDADLDGVPNLSDNCPGRYNPAQANTRGLTCSDGINQGDACTLDAQCPGTCSLTMSTLCRFDADCPGGETCVDPGTCSVQDARGDDCDSTTADPDQDGVFDATDNCPDLSNVSQIDSDANRVGDACERIQDLIALEGPPTEQVEIFFGLPGGSFGAPVVLPVAADPASMLVGRFTAGDPHLDLVVSSRAGGSLQVFAGDGSGGFAPLPPVAAGGSPAALVALEANGLDLDLDSVPNASDNCPVRANPSQSDADDDGLGDACSQVEDPDADTVLTRIELRGDNCPDLYNPAQTDGDGDGIGDACDVNPGGTGPGDDNDSDGVPDAGDNCPTRYNPGQADSSGNGLGDDCDEFSDPDADAVFTARRIRDNCPDTYNPGQEDVDFNGIGDACENVSDLAVVDETGSALLLFIQFPPGNLTPLPPLAVGASPSGLTSPDLNDDGIPDLVVANEGDSTLNVFLGNGDGTFLTDPAFFTVPVLPSPRGLVSGRFRRDLVEDLPEVATLSPPLNNPVILVNVVSERADIDGSGRVGGMDIARWTKGFGLARGDPGYAAALDADINLDGAIDGLDLVYLTVQFGRIIPPP